MLTYNSGLVTELNDNHTNTFTNNSFVYTKL